MAASIIQHLAPIKDLGVYRDCKLANAKKFLQYNLIYGFNGSGKTTLSRIFASLEAGALRPELPEGGTFEVQLSDGTSITSTGPLTALQGRMLVFNVDFIEESFKWKEGVARPVFYLGREQAALAEQLSRTTTALYDLNEPLRSADSQSKSAQRELAQFKRDVARLVAEQLGLGRRYDASNLTSDYSRFRYSDSQLLSEDQRSHLRTVLAQEAPLSKRVPIPVTTPQLEKLFARVRPLADTTLGAMTLDDLRDHESMRGWLTDGLAYHAEKSLKTCLFCAGELREERLTRLREAIDEKFSQVKAAIADADSLAASVLHNCVSSGNGLPSLNDISQTVRQEYKELIEHRSALLKEATEVAALLREVLSEKSNSLHVSVEISSEITPERCTKIDAALKENTDSINSILEKHNIEYHRFDEAKGEASQNLKAHYLAESESRYKELENEVTKADNDLNQLEKERDTLKKEEERLKKEVRQHGPAAKFINKLIQNYLGRKEIQLVTRDDGYQLERNGRIVQGSLSEGEKTAVALCYFLSTLEAEGRKRKDLIVVIDDPISSLDSRALNYAFSIVKSALGDAGQLFLLTHNLNFMNEAKKWLKPKTEKEAARRAKPGTAALLFLDSIHPDGEARSTTIIDLPKHIRDYESEYHYLFHLILKFYESPEAQSQYIYIIPNALRKVLEIFLAFKVPGPEGLTSKIETIERLDHGIDPGRISALGRLAQVESHADNLDDLVNFSSMTVEESKEATSTLIDLIAALDREHYSRITSICKAN
ncbi:AAA family ATPase [Cupriavidus nantongensis]